METSLELIKAVRSNNTERAVELIEAGADVNCIEIGAKYTCPVLILAIFKGNETMAELLLSKGANPNCERVHNNVYRYGALRDAIFQWPNDNIAKMLIEAGADVNYNEFDEACGEKFKRPVLISAILKGNEAMVELLLKKGANPNGNIVFNNGECRSALQNAVFEQPNENIAKMLIEAGADVNYNCSYWNWKRPILMEAVMSKDCETMVELLLKNGANPNCETVVKDGQRQSPLAYSSNYNIVKMLIEAGADVNYIEIDNKVKRPVLNGAISTGNEKLVELLLKNGANPNCERVYDNGNRKSALDDAIFQWPNDNIAKMLIEAGADVNYISINDEMRCSVLNSAILKGNETMVELLLKNGANPNCERMFNDGCRFSALCDAIELTNNNIVKMLIEAGADVNHIEIDDDLIRDSYLKRRTDQSI